MRTINNKQTLPLNGWRCRTLAEYYFGDKKHQDKFTEGMSFLVPARVLQELPDFDGANQAYADSFTGEVILTVELEDGSYDGIHVSVSPAKTYNEMCNDYSSWGDYLKVDIVEGKYTAVMLYWRDIRKEDLILNLPAETIRGAKLLKVDKTLCKGYVTDNDLVYRILQCYGDAIKAKLTKACVL
jgi:hypothetical protein